MALFNYATRELSAKIVYYGPGLSGKTTNIEMVHRFLRPDQKGRLISLPTETDRTLFFDFLPVDLGQIKGFKVRFHLYTVPGQVFYNATRRLVLQGVDGVVFVADSQAAMEQSNIESLKNLADNLASYGKRLEDLPFVLQYNKRDLKQISSVSEMDEKLNPLSVPVYEGIAKDGIGVSETLVAISRKVFSHLRKTLLMPGEAAEHEEIAELADARIAKTFLRGETAPLEEIAEIEEIQEFLNERPAPVPVSPAADKEQAPVAGGEVPDEIELLNEGSPPVEAAETAEPAPVVASEEIDIEIPERELPPSPPHPPAPVVASEEIDIEIPERELPLSPPHPSAPQAVTEPRAGITPKVEEGELTFLKFDNPYVSPGGHAVIPAVFMDGAGNIVRIRIRITMEEQG